MTFESFLDMNLKKELKNISTFVSRPYKITWINIRPKAHKLNRKKLQCNSILVEKGLINKNVLQIPILN